MQITIETIYTWIRKGHSSTKEHLHFQIMSDQWRVEVLDGSPEIRAWVKDVCAALLKSVISGSKGETD